MRSNLTQLQTIDDSLPPPSAVSDPPVELQLELMGTNGGHSTGNELLFRNSVHHPPEPAASPAAPPLAAAAALATPNPTSQELGDSGPLAPSRRRPMCRRPRGPPAPPASRRVLPPLDFEPRILVPERSVLFQRTGWDSLRAVLRVWHLPVRWEGATPVLRRAPRAALPVAERVDRRRLRLRLDLAPSEEERAQAQLALAEALRRCLQVRTQRRRVLLESSAWRGRRRVARVVALQHTFYAHIAEEVAARLSRNCVLVAERAGRGGGAGVRVAGVRLRFGRTHVQVEDTHYRPARRTQRTADPHRPLLTENETHAAVTLHEYGRPASTSSTQTTLNNDSALEQGQRRP